MRYFLLGLLLAMSAIAQPVISNVQLTVSHGSVVLRTDITNAEDQWLVQMDYGTTPALGYSTRNRASGSPDPSRTLLEGGLSPSTTYYFRIRVSVGSGTTEWSCTAGSSGPGWTCDAGSGTGMFHTLALPPDHGEPQLPSPVNTAMPAVNGQTFNVTADCSNLQATLNACALANPSLVHQVLIPTGAVCRGTYDLPAKTGSGVCIVRSAAPDKELPPEGVRVDPSFAPKMPRIVFPLAGTGALGHLRGVLNADSTEGWRLLGLSFELDSPLAHRKTPISAVAADGTITTSVPHGLQFGQQIYVAGVQGFRGKGPNGSWTAWAFTPNTLQLASAPYSVLGEPDFSCAQTAPCYVPGTGYLVQTAGSSIISATATTPPVVTTALEHGLFNEPWWNIISASGPVITLESGHTIDWRSRPVEIAGSSVAAYNGVWTTPWASAVSLTLNGGPASASCSANCGRIRMKRAIHIRGAQGATGLNGNHLYTVIDDTKVQIDDATGGVYTGSGVLSFDPDYYFNMLRFYSTASRIIIDRCIVKGAEWPNRVLFGIVLSSQDSALIDSRVENIKNWRTVNPKTLETEYGGETFPVTSIAVDMTRGDRKKISNNYINANGVSIFAQEWEDGHVVEDVTISRNTIYSDPADMSGGSASSGLYYRKRHQIEVKQGKRFLIEGNIMDGNWSDWTPCAPALLLSPRAASYSVNQISDILIRNNTIRNSTSGLQIAGTDDMPEGKMGFLTQRVKIDNNLTYDIDNRKWSSRPNAVGGSGICGYAYQALFSVEDLTISHNTAFDMRGSQTQFFGYLYGRGEGVVLRHNLFSHNNDNGAGGLTPSYSFYGMVPPISGTIKQGWDQYFPFGSEFRDNAVIPGVKDTSAVSNYDSTSTYLESYSQPECVDYYAGFTRTTCFGSGAASETANKRIAAVKFFDSTGRDLRLRFDSQAKAGARPEGLDAGANIDILESAQGKVRNVRLQSGTTSATLSYIAPDSAACFVDYGTDPLWSAHTRVSDNGGLVTRSISFTGLSAGTLYYYRVECASEQPQGSFVTLR